jgi:phosphoenolpyruvate phosphomutase
MKDGKIVVYVDMVGDLFHVGHLNIINRAKELGDFLIVGVHPDHIVKNYKRTPIIPFEQRKKIIEAIKGVDLVVTDCRMDESPNQIENFKKYGVDIAVHADDFKPVYVKAIKEHKLDIKFVQVPYTLGISTTDLIKKIKDRKNLRHLLHAKEKLVIVSASDAITGKLIEQYGFDGIWLSSFEVSASHGLVDNETMTLTEMRDTAKSVIDATNIPVIIDADTGYGNINNVARALQEFEKIGAAAICFEDNVYPKRNSLFDGKIPILSTEAMGNKIKACVEARQNKNFCIIARTESLIRGYGMEDAMNRGNHYAVCGADLILFHSRDESGQEALEVARRWDKEVPLVIIPSKFPQLTNPELFEAGYSIVIYANQTQRCKIQAVKEMLKTLKTKQCGKALETKICSLDDFRALTPIKETKRLEAKYGR